MDQRLLDRIERVVRAVTNGFNQKRSPAEEAYFSINRLRDTRLEKEICEIPVTWV